MPYIDSAGVKLNKNADLIIEADASGAVKSCRDAVTGEEYAGSGGSLKKIKVNISNTANAAKVMGVLAYDPGNTNKYQGKSKSIAINTVFTVEDALLMPGDIIFLFSTQFMHSSLTQLENAEEIGFSYIGTASQPYLYTLHVIDTVKDVNLTLS